MVKHRTGAVFALTLALAACETVPQVEGTFPPAMELGEPRLPPGSGGQPPPDGKVAV